MNPGQKPKVQSGAEEPKARKKPAPRDPRKARIVLPFDNRRKDPGTWAYEHRVGLSVTVIAYLLFGIAFITSKIVIGRDSPDTYIIVDVPDPEDQPQPEREELTAEEREALAASLQNVRNVTSNENAREEITPDQARRALPQSIAQMGEEVADRLQRNREAYERGLREERDIIDSRNDRPNDNAADPGAVSDGKVAGSVTASFNLEGRTAVDIPKPSYRCQGGGQVIVSITVDRNGNVTAASVQSAITNDNCVRERAVEFALMARFNTDPNAPASQKGTITYIFVPQ